MKIPSELEGARLNIARTAELVAMDPGHFRRLVRRGVFPTPKRTGKGMPFYDHELLCRIGQVLKSGVGCNDEEISFYRRKPKQFRHQPRSPRQEQQRVSEPDSYIASVIEGCRQLGVADAMLYATKIKAILTTEFGDDRPELERALPVVARQLMGGNG